MLTQRCGGYNPRIREQSCLGSKTIKRRFQEGLLDTLFLDDLGREGVVVIPPADGLCRQIADCSCIQCMSRAMSLMICETHW